MNRFRKFMYGRHGSDQLGFALLVLAMAIMVASSFIPISSLSFLSFIPLIFCFYRMFSRDTQKRRQENDKYLRWRGRFIGWFKGIPARIRDGRRYRRFSCPKCGQRVRVPKGKGKISITCPKCKEKFVRKS